MNFRWKGPILFAFAISLLAFSKSFSNPDSLLLELRKPYHDTIKFDILISIGDYFEYSQPDTAIAYYTEAVELTTKNLNESSILENKYLKLKGKALRYIGYVHLNQGDYQTASQHYFEALQIAEKLEDQGSIYNCYNNIGIINHMQKDYNVAKEYYNKAMDILEQANDRSGKSKLYINIGNLYSDHGDNSENLKEKEEFYVLALTNYENALEIKIEIGDIKGQSLCCNNLGNLLKKRAKLINNEAERINLFKESRRNYLKSIALSEKINDKSGLSLAFGNLSDLYTILYSQSNLSHEKKIIYADSAIFYGSKSYNLAIDLNSIYLQNKTALLLKNTYSLLGEAQKALQFADIFIETRDRMFSDEKTKALKEMMTRYETEKKEKEIHFQQLELQKTRFRLFVVLAAAGIFIIAISFLGFVLRLKHKTEKILESKNRQLIESNATKDKFFSIISHDLRSPVSGFRNLSALIGQNFELLSNDQIKEYVIDLSKSADETVSLLNNLLQWSKSQQNKIEVKKFPVSIHRLINKLSEEFATKLKEKSITLNAEIVDSDNVEIDENIISTIIRNLISNAIKFSPPNSVIEIFSSISDVNYRISVKDQGIGMTDEDCKKLFRIECDTKSIGNSLEKGSGLGLILCKELVNLHGGSIWVESTIGEGSTFSFTLPLEISYGKV